MHSAAVPLRILLLDDHPGSCATMSFVLRLRGHQCLSVASVREATIEGARFQPNVVLYEWILARAEQRGTAAVLRTALPGALLVVLSAIEEPAGFRDVERVDGYFTKPVNMQLLDDTLAGAHR